MGVIAVSGSAYPMRHNLTDLQGLNFHTLTLTALQEAVQKKRPRWGRVVPQAVLAADPSLDSLFAVQKDNASSVSETAREKMAQAARVLETRFFLVFETVSIRDAGSPQFPSALVAGATLQVWDFEKGKLVYRGRSTTRTIDYSDKNFKKKLKDELFDLSAALLSPLPKK